MGALLIILTGAQSARVEAGYNWIWATVHRASTRGQFVVGAVSAFVRASRRQAPARSRRSRSGGGQGLVTAERMSACGGAPNPYSPRPNVVGSGPSCSSTSAERHTPLPEARAIPAAQRHGEPIGRDCLGRAPGQSTAPARRRRSRRRRSWYGATGREWTGARCAVSAAARIGHEASARPTRTD